MNQELKLKLIVSDYFIAKESIYENSFAGEDFDYYNPLYIYYRDVEIAFSRLNSEEKLIIHNDYFVEHKDNWWNIVFTKEDYLRIKRNAIKKFLRIFYAIH